MKKMRRINNEIVKTAESSAVLDKEIPEMQVAVAELRHIYEATGNKENQKKKKNWSRGLSRLLEYHQ